MTVFADFEMKVKGRYKVIARRPDMSIREESEWSDNLIVAVGINWLMGGNDITSVGLYGLAGSGSTPPSMSDTSLQSQIGGSLQSIAFDTSTWNTTTAPYYGRRTITFRGTQGQIVGNVSEVGVTTQYGNFISRALVVDSNGAPTTVTVLSDEYLDIVWEFSVYFTGSSGKFNMVIDGITTEFDFVITPANMTLTQTNGGWNWMAQSSGNGMIRRLFPQSTASGSVANETQTLGQINGQPANSTGNAVSSASAAAYVSNSFQREMTWLWTLTQANYATGIGSFMFSCIALAWQMRISPKVMKTNQKNFSITFRVSMANA